MQEQETSQTTGKREESRLRLNLEAYATLLHSTHRAVLCDLSTTGAKIRTEEPLRVNADIAVRWGIWEGFGWTAWSEGQLTGVRFYEPMEWETVLATRRRQDERGLSEEGAHRWLSYFSYVCGKVFC